MYEHHFKLALLPFENTPDGRFFFASEQHREALAAIEYTIRMRKGFVLVTGEVGTGKTTVGRVMRDRCSEHVTLVEVTYGHLGREELLRQVLRAIGLQTESDADHSVLVEQLRGFLQEQLRVDRPVVLFIDEAQTLADEVLEELRLMSNLDTATAKAIQIVLVGQPELRLRLRDPVHSALRQRIVMARQIEPLNFQETGQYIYHRIRAASVDAGDPGVTFNVDVINTIYQFSNGIPRLINIACDSCLLMAYVREQTEITTSIVHKVMADMMPNLEICSPGVPAETAEPPALALAGAG